MTLYLSFTCHMHIDIACRARANTEISSLRPVACASSTNHWSSTMCMWAHELPLHSPQEYSCSRVCKGMCCALSHSLTHSKPPSASVSGSSGLAAGAPERELAAEPREERCDGAEREEAPREEREREEADPCVEEPPWIVPEREETN